MPLTYDLAGAPRCRPAQPIPQPIHTPHSPQRHTYTPAGKQASQAKPHQKHTQHKTNQQSQINIYPPTLLLRFSSSAWPNCSVAQQHIQTDAQTLKKMLRLSPAPSSLSCHPQRYREKPKRTPQNNSTTAVYMFRDEFEQLQISQNITANNQCCFSHSPAVV